MGDGWVHMHLTGDTGIGIQIIGIGEKVQGVAHMRKVRLHSGQ